MTGKVKGGSIQPPKISVGKEYVYLRSNFEQVTETNVFDEEQTYWQWDEVIIPLKQYIEQITTQNEELENAILELSELI